MKTSNFIVAAIVAILVGVAGFFGGMTYQKSKVPQSTRQLPGGPVGVRGSNQQRFGGQGFRPVVGQIISQDDKSITVKLSDGSSKIVLFSSGTVINKTTTGLLTDLKVGENVGVFGTTNPDGSVTAQSIQLNPMFGGTGNPNQNQGQ